MSTDNKKNEKEHSVEERLKALYQLQTYLTDIDRIKTLRGELPNEEMYMSGRSLFPLTIEMCSRISRQFNGKMRF